MMVPVEVQLPSGLLALLQQPAQSPGGPAATLSTVTDPAPALTSPKAFLGSQGQKSYCALAGNSGDCGSIQHLLKKNKEQQKNPEKPKKQPSSVVEEDSCAVTSTKRVTTNSFPYVMCPNVFPARLA